jgi:hypothetical protein
MDLFGSFSSRPAFCVDLDLGPRFVFAGLRLGLFGEPRRSLERARQRNGGLLPKLGD